MAAEPPSCRAAVLPPTVSSGTREEEEKAREEAVVKELEEKMAKMVQRLAEKVQEVARVTSTTPRPTSRTSSVRPAPSSAAPRCSGRRRRGRRGRRGGGGGETGTGLGSWSAAPHDASSILSSVVCVSVSGCCLRCTFVVFWGRRLPDLLSYSASLGSTEDTRVALVGVFLRPPVPGSYMFGARLA